MFVAVLGSMCHVRISRSHAHTVFACLGELSKQNRHFP